MLQLNIIFCSICIYTEYYFLIIQIFTLLGGAVEYTNCISAKGYDPHTPNKCPV